MPRFLIFFLLSGIAFAQAPNPGRTQFEGHCAVCHGRDGAGGEHGPAIQTRIGNYNDAELANLIHEGLPKSGMPGTDLPATETNALVTFLQSIKTSADGAALVRTTVTLNGGQTLIGLVLNQGSQEMQLLADGDQKIHLLRKDGATWRAVTSQSDWPTYNGVVGGNRYTLARSN